MGRMGWARTTKCTRSQPVCYHGRSAMAPAAMAWQDTTILGGGCAGVFVHPKFGRGVIIGAEGRGADARVQVNFQTEGMKWLALEYAKLTAA